MLIPAGFILLLWLAWLAVKIVRNRKAKIRRRENRESSSRIIGQVNDILEWASLTGKDMVIHRGLPGYCILMVHADFQARLAERGKIQSGHPEFERIDRALEWWMPRETGMIALAGDGLCSFHKGHLDDPDIDSDLMPVTHSVDDVARLLQALNVWYDYLELPGSLDKARHRKAAAPVAEVVQPLPPRAERVFDINPANKMDHIIEYIEDGDPRTFDDMFYGDFDHAFVLWVDHGESDDDIVTHCERILKTGELKGWFDDDSLDLIISYRGDEHRVKYPNGYADRDTTMIGLSKVLRPAFELRYCKASDGSDTAAFLPLPCAEWQALEARFGERLNHYFEVVDADFSKFGREA